MHFSISDEHIEKYRTLSSREERRYTLQEELAELIQELSKINRNRDNGVLKLEEEMTHVLISLYSVAKDHGIEQSDIYFQVKMKEKYENGEQ